VDRSNGMRRNKAYTLLPDRAGRDKDRLGSSSNHGGPPGIQVFVYAHDLLDCIEIHAHGLGVYDRGVLLCQHAAVAPRQANEWH
jgi:hypothetical protein